MCGPVVGMFSKRIVLSVRRDARRGDIGAAEEAVDEMPEVRSAWVLDERVFGLGRYADGGIETVREAALLRPAQ